LAYDQREKFKKAGEDKKVLPDLREEGIDKEVQWALT